MSRSLWFAVVFCLVALVGMFALTTPALADTITLSNNTPGTADGSTLARTVTINPGDLPFGEPLTFVRVTIDFDKIDDGDPPAGCGATPGSDPWNEEMFFYITSPAGTRVVLVESDDNGGGSGLGPTYPTGWVYNGPYSVVFDDAAPSAPGPAPLSGTFQPVQPLSGFVGESPFGVWTLTMGDDQSQDPLCFAAFALELTAGVDTDLVLDKTGPASAVAGQSITYTIVVTNNGPLAAPLVEVVDDLPDQVAFVGATLARSGSGPAGECAYATCQAADVQVGEVLTMTLTGQVDPAVPAGTVLTNQANAFADGDPTPDNGDGHATTVQAVADLQIWKSVLPDEICVAGYGFYELTVTNGGPSTAADVTVTDMLPAGITFSGGSPECGEAGGTVTCAIGALAPGATYDFLVGFDVDASVVSGTVVANTAAASTTTTDPNAANDTATASFTAVECGLPEANLAITKTVDPPAVVAGEELTFTLTITNNGPHAAEGVIVQDLFYVPMEIVTLDADPFDWSCDGGVTCVRQNAMDAGASEAITIVVRVPSSDEPMEYVNMAFVSADNPDPDTGDNWAMVPYSVTAQANLTITKSALVGELVAGGDEGQFSIMVTNEGPSSAYDVEVVDLPDAGLELVALQPGPAAPMTCLSDTCTIDVLAAGQTAEIYAVVQAPPSTAAGTYTNTACLGDEPSLVFSPGPGTGAPPPDLGPYTMTPFPLDGRPLGNAVTDVPGPTGNLLFDRSTYHVRIGSGWASWSHGYTGDVYSTNGATTLVMTLPPGTGAFYFYVEPNPFSWINIEATAQDGTTSGEIAVNGSGGAHYFGFYALGHAPLSTISITAGSDFAVGEFGIAEGMMTGAGCAAAALPVVAQADLALVKMGPLTATVGIPLTYTLTIYNNGPSDATTAPPLDGIDAGIESMAGSFVAFDPAAGGETCYLPGAAQTFCFRAESYTTDWEYRHGVWLRFPAGWSVSDVYLVGTPVCDSGALGWGGFSWAFEAAPGEVHISHQVNNHPVDHCVATYCVDAAPGAGAGDAPVSWYWDGDGYRDAPHHPCSSDQYTPPSMAGQPCDEWINPQAMMPRCLGVAGPVIVTDTLPYGFEYVDSMPPGLCLETSPGVVACGLANGLTAGSAVSIELVVQADPGVCYDGQVENTAVVAAGVPDPDPSNNDDAWGTILFSQADLALTKTTTPVAAAGEAITYTITVENNGPLTAARVVVTDTLPAGVTLVATSGCDEDPNGAPVCSLGDLAPQASASYTLVVLSDSNLEPGSSLENRASARSDTGDCNLANNSDDADTSILANTELLLQKTGPDTAIAGEFITYTIVVTNVGPSAVPLLDVKDDLPDEVAFYDADVVRSGQGPMGLCGYGVCQVPDVAAGEAVVVTLIGLVDPATPAFITLTNEAMAFADSDPAPDAYDTHDTLVFAQADLTIEKRVLKDELCLGAYGLYEIAITNHGPSTSRGITVTDVLSDALIYGGGSPECVHDGSPVGGVVTCTLASLAPGASHDFLLGFNVVPSTTTGTAIWNEAEVSSATHDTGEDNRADATFTVTQCLLPEADLAITKAVAPAPVVAGENLTFTLTVANNGPHMAEGVTVQDLFFQSIDIVDVVVDPLNWSCDGGVTCMRQQPMPAGVSETITIIAQVPANAAPGEYVNTAFVTADNPDPDTGDNWAMAGYTVTAEANLAIAKVGMPDPVIAGATILYQVQVTNSGPSVAYDVVVTDTLPAGTTFAGASPECAVMGEVVTCSLGDLGVGLPASVWIMARVDEGLADGTLVTNRACVVSTTNDNDNTPQCAADEALVERSLLNPTDLVLTKMVLETDPVGEVYTGTQFADGAAVAGGTVIYQIVVENAGPAPATDVVVYDALPYRFTMVEAEFEHNGSPDSPIGPFLCTQESCALGLIPAGRTVTVTLTVLVEPNAPLSFDPWQLFSNEAVVQAANPDPELFNNADSASVTVEPLVELDILKESIPAVVVPGEELTYQIHVYNYGPSDATADSSQMLFGFYDPLVVMDTLPAEIDPASVWWETSGNPYGCLADVVCLLNLPAGHETVLTIHGQVYPDVTQPFSNTALAGDFWNFMSGGVPVSDTVETLVAPEADLAVDKTGPMTVTAGGLLTYTVTVHNNGPSDAQNVVVSDTLPYGVVAASPITFNLGTVAAGETITRQVVGRSDPNACYQGKVNNVVEVTSATPDPDPTNNDDAWGTIILSLASLEISKSASPDPVFAGDLVEFVLVITNTGPGCASGVSIIDELGYEGNPAGLAMESYVSTSTQGTGPLADYWHSCSSGGACVRAEPMPAGTVDTITLRLRVPASTQPGEYENYADAIWDSGSVNTWVLYQVEAAADLTIDKRVLQDELCLGAYGLYEIVVHNEGPSTAQEIMVTDVLSDALVFGGGSPECTHDGSAVGGTVTCVLPSLGPGESHDFLIGFNIASTVIGGTEIDNEATVASATYDPLPNLPASATFTAVQCLLPEANLAITKAVAPATVVAGENLTFTLTVANNGPHMAEGVTVQDLFFQSIDVVDVVVDPLDWSCDGGVTCVRQQPMPAGVSETITIIAQVPANAVPGEYVNTAFVTADNPDPDTGDNWTVAGYTVTAEADLRIEKSVIKDEICIGATSGAYGFYEIVVTNDGPSTATAITVTDVLSDALIYGGGSPECVHDGSAVGGTVTCTLASLDAGASHDFLIGFYIAPQVVDSTAIWNEAVVSSATFDPGDENRDDAVFTATQCLLPDADLAVSKAVEPAAVAAGEEITFTVTITNNGLHAAAGVVVQDLYFWSMDVTAIYVNTHDWSCDGGLTCVRHNPMDAGATDVLTFVLRIPADTEPGLYTNYAFVSADNPDPNTWDNTAMAPYAVGATADLTITKSLLTPDVVPGGTALFEIVVGNDGPSDADGVAVTDLVLGPGVLSWISSDAGDLYIPAGQTRDVLAMVRVNDMAQPGDTITNCAYVNDLPQGPTNEACAVLTVGGSADLAVTKTATPAAHAGELITYTVTLYNAGPAIAHNVVITDDLPAGVALGAITGGPGSCIGSDPVVCTSSVLTPGETISFNLIVTSEAGLEPGTSLENQVWVASDTPDGDLADNYDDADTAITGLADLSLDKAGPGTIVAGTTITYTIVADNAGPSVARSVAVVDDLPPGVILVSATVTRTGAGPSLCGGTVCELGEVAPAETVTMTLVGLVDPGVAPGTILTNSAAVLSSTPDDNPSDNDDQVATMVEAEADLAVDKVDLADPVEPLAGFLYQVNVSNLGTSDAHDVVVVDTLGDGLYFSTASPGCTGQPGDQVITCTLSVLEADESSFFLLAVTAGDVPSGTQLINDVAVNGATADPDGSNNIDQEVTTVRQEYGPSADLAIIKTATPAQVTAGELVTYVLTITNAGPLAATNVEVLELIPVDTELVSIVADNPDFGYEFCTLAGVCSLGTVQPGTTIATVTALLRVDADCQATSLTNVASVSGDQVDHHPDNNFDSAVVGVAPLSVSDLALDKNATPTTHAGGLITYTLAVWNLGPQPAPGVLVTDTLPPGVALARVDTGCVEASAGTVECTALLLDAGQALTFTLVVTVDAHIEPGSSLENRAVVASPAGDPDPSNNADAADTSIIGRTDLALTKTGPEWILRGELVTYTLVITNEGPATAQSVDVKDDLPAGITLVSAVVARYGQAPALCGGTVCQVGDMAAGEVITVTLVGQADAHLAAGLLLTNVATVFSDTPEEDLSNNRDEHMAPVRLFSIYLPVVSKGQSTQPSLPDLVGSFTLTPDQTEYGSDEAVLITVMVTNQGHAPAGPFWVDFYLNPDPVPTGSGLLWNEACALVPCYGLTWQVPAGLAPGESVTLTSTPDSYDVERSLWTGYFAPGTSDLYLFVDSWAQGSSVGAVLELDEANNRAERHGLVVSGDVGGPAMVTPQFPTR